MTVISEYIVHFMFRRFPHIQSRDFKENSRLIFLNPCSHVALHQILDDQKHKTFRETINWASRNNFFHDGKGSWGHVLDQNGPRRPPWNTLKKCFLLRKRPKEDERVAQGHFHERVTESPRSHGIGGYCIFFHLKITAV